MAAPAGGGGGALPPAAAAGDEAGARLAANGADRESVADSISVSEVEEDGVDPSDPGAEEPSPSMHQPVVSLDVTDAAISKDELGYQLDGGGAGAGAAWPLWGGQEFGGSMWLRDDPYGLQREPARRLHCHNVLLSLSPLLVLLPPSPAAGAGAGKKDAPCIVLPHQSDYVPHIALDIGAWGRLNAVCCFG